MPPSWQVLLLNITPSRYHRKDGVYRLLTHIRTAFGSPYILAKNIGILLDEGFCHEVTKAENTVGRQMEINGSVK